MARNKKGSQCVHDDVSAWVGADPAAGGVQLNFIFRDQFYKSEMSYKLFVTESWIASRSILQI